MPNMSYCRFQNTFQDLRDCSQHLWDSDEEIGYDEAKARRNLVELCRDIVEECGDEYTA